MRTLPVLLALSLVACGGSDKAESAAPGTDTSTGTATTETTFPLTNDAQVEEAFGMATLPSMLYLMTMFTATDAGTGTDACPVVVETQTGMTITGACTSTDGTAYTGSVVIAYTESGGRVTYDNWGWNGADLLNVDGTHAIGADTGLSVAEVSTEEAGDGLRVTGRDASSGMNLSVTFTSFNQRVPLFDAAPGNYPIQAAYSAVGLTGSGAATLEGSYTYTAECDTGPSNATFTLTGAQRVTLSVASCDTNDCTHWEAADGTSGNLCDGDPTSTDTDTFTATGTGTSTAAN
jgi:hypothetical protein